MRTPLSVECDMSPCGDQRRRAEYGGLPSGAGDGREKFACGLCFTKGNFSAYLFPYHGKMIRTITIRSQTEARL